MPRAKIEIVKAGTGTRNFYLMDIVDFTFSEFWGDNASSRRLCCNFSTPITLVTKGEQFIVYQKEIFDEII